MPDLRADEGQPRWQPPRLWRVAMHLARFVVRILARLDITGSVPADHRGLVLAANHISPFDPIVLTAACRTVDIKPRILANAGLFRTPVIGGLFRAAGHIRVDRGEPTAGQALTDAAQALAEQSVVLVYPEGRITLDPGLWPERGRTGVARLALSTGVPVIPVAIWGAHEVLPYAAPKGMWPMLWRAVRHRPVVKVDFGAPLDLAGMVDARMPGAAQAATELLMDAIEAQLKPLRAEEPDRPRWTDPTRPVSTQRSRRRQPGR